MRQTSFLALVATLITSSGILAAPGPPQQHPPHCRCRPTDPCWPSSSQWKKLNTTLDGNLVAVRPIAAVCHDPTFDAAACTVVNATQHNSAWLSAQPGTVQHFNWNSRPERNETCYIGTPQGVPCGQGRVSLFSAVVKTPQHVQAAVKFAAANDLRLAVKNTGHCFLGRSSAPESLQILTHNLKSIEFTDDFQPQGCGKGAKGAGSAVTIGAGIQLKELYAALGERGLAAVAGLAHTVGAAGGYIQGGGHSPLGTWKGMSADNALEFTVVTAKGDLVVANDYQNTDLFWALRGGGGGTWGVVTSVTIRTFPDVPAVYQSFTMATTNVTGFWAVVEDLHARLPAINDAGGSGYYFITPGQGTMQLIILFVGEADEAAVAKIMDPFVDGAIATVGNDSVPVRDRAVAPLTKYFFDEALKGDADVEGDLVRIGSRLVSREFLVKPGGALKLTEALKGLYSFEAPGGTGTITGHVVAGGQVARNKGVDNAINPAWRRTVTHLAFGLGWDVNTSPADVKRIETGITEQMVPLVSKLEPDMGAYLNEADSNEKDWQQSFWGAKYERLSLIKRKWDPQALFITRRGVGSESWDEDGLCRV